MSDDKQVNAPEQVTPTAEAPKSNMGMVRNHHLKNKFAVGDEVWAVVALGPDLKVGKYPVRGMNAEFLGEKWVYMYHLPIASDGHADAINMTVVKEDLMFFDREAAEARAYEAVKDVHKEYDEEIKRVTEDYEKQMEESKSLFERTIAKLVEEKEKCNADDLIIQPRVVEAEKEDKPSEASKTGVKKITNSAPSEDDKTTSESPLSGVETTEDCLICGQKKGKEGGSSQCVCPQKTQETDKPLETEAEPVDSASEPSIETDGEPGKPSEPSEVKAGDGDAPEGVDLPPCGTNEFIEKCQRHDENCPKKNNSNESNNNNTGE